MYAVIKTGGKQYKVVSGQTLKIELLDIAPGEEVVFNEVLMVAEGESISIGTPNLAGAAVKAEVVKIGRAKKIRIIKMRRRKHHRKTMGHRQWFTQVKITEIKAA